MGSKVVKTGCKSEENGGFDIKAMFPLYLSPPLGGVGGSEQYFGYFVGHKKSFGYLAYGPAYVVHSMFTVSNLRDGWMKIT